tara:strand:- start:151 stop:465 length:315 start_codon:yes stop_codon:yes gene_type:complete
MAQLYKSITTADTHELIAKSETIRTGSSSITTISICNESANAATVSLALDPVTASPFYIIKNVVIPSGVTLVLDNAAILRFDSRYYKLRIENSGTSPDLTVIIK